MKIDNEPAAIVHVLLVEDHERLRAILRQSLTAEGFAVTAAASADAALALLRDGLVPDVLFTDIRMSGSIDGLELARWVHQRLPEVRVLLQTGYADVPADEFTVLLKPFTPEELHVATRRLLAARQR